MLFILLATHDPLFVALNDPNKILSLPTMCDTWRGLPSASCLQLLLYSQRLAGACAVARPRFHREDTQP